MWDEYIKLQQNNFYIAKNWEDEKYKIINTNGENIIIDNVIRWFNNGFFLTQEEHYYHHESRDGVDLSYNEYTFKIYNNNLEIIFRTISRNKKHLSNLKEFIGDFLLLNGGAIDINGNEVLPFKFSEEEAEHRLLIRNPVKNSSTENACTNAANSIIYESRKENFKSIEMVNGFINYLLNDVCEIHKIIYHLLLRRYSYSMVEEFDGKTENDLLLYDKKEFILNRYDITYIISEIQQMLNLSESLTINYWDRWNMSYSYQVIEMDIQTYFFIEDSTIIENRKRELAGIVQKMPLKYFSLDKFKQLSKEYEQIIKNSNPFIKGRKIYIQEYQTFESNFINKKENLPRIPCIYLNPANFLDKNNFDNYHVVQETLDSTNFHIVESNAINIDLIVFNYNDYIELIKSRQY